MFNLSKVKKIYFIGIGGIGMSAAAGIAKSQDFEVLGSDDKSVYDPAKAVLDKFSIPYKIGYAAENFSGADLVVVSAAIEQGNPELQKAISQKAQVISYPQLLSALTVDKRRTVIVGTNGKGSTSGLIGYILKNLNNSSYFIGGVLVNDAANFYYGDGPEFIIEGDEYRAGYDDLTPKFIYYRPDILLINNLELDHPDIYKNIDELKKVFKDLVSAMPANGIIIYNADDQNVLDVVTGSNLQTLSFGFTNKSADIFAEAPVADPEGNFIVKAMHNGREIIFKSFFPGLVYGYNNLAAVSVLIALGYNPEEFISLIPSYRGLKRRFEIISEQTGITIIDDYAHHPSAVLGTLKAVRQKYPTRRIIAFFEPHTYSRTKETLPELATAFEPADLAFISEIYPAREQKLPSSITSQQVVAEISKHHQNVFYVQDQAAAQKKLKEIMQPGDVVIVMSVGPYKVI